MIRKLLIFMVVLFISSMGIAQDCWAFNRIRTVEDKVGIAHNSKMCMQKNKDLVITLRGEDFLFKYISHDVIYVSDLSMDVHVLKVRLGASNIYTIFVYNEDIGVIVVDEEDGTPYRYYNE